jgi:protein-tyrosine phosphatase
LPVESVKMKRYKVLFVCLGNICRSPMAEYVLRHQAQQAGVGARIEVTSAGTSGWHNGEDMHPGTAAMLKQHGISPSGFTSSQVHPLDAEEYDVIVAMDDSNIEALKRVIRFDAEQTFKLTDLIPESGYQHVPDPWHTDDFDETYRLVSAGSRALLSKLGLL